MSSGFHPRENRGCQGEEAAVCACSLPYSKFPELIFQPKEGGSAPRSPSLAQPKRWEHPGILLFWSCYLSLFEPKSDNKEGKHKAAFMLPALQVAAFSNGTFRCIAQSKEIMFLEITVGTLIENNNKNRNKEKLRQRHIWSKFDIYKSWTSGFVFDRSILIQQKK